jgi:hypothetical protein
MGEPCVTTGSATTFSPQPLVFGLQFARRVCRRPLLQCQQPCISEVAPQSFDFGFQRLVFGAR